MASVRHLGLFPGECSTFPVVQSLRWRKTFLGSPPEDLGIASLNAYLAMNKRQVAFVFWRVKKWEIVCEIGPVDISNQVTIVFTDVGTQYIDTEFAFPLSTISRTVDSSHLIQGDTEKKLVCRSFGGIPQRGADGEEESLSISSSFTNTFDPPADPEFFDNSRDAFNIVFSLNGFDPFFDFEQGIEFDIGRINDVFYYPLLVTLVLNIGNGLLDGIIFDEAAEVASQEDEDEEISGTIPPIGGALTSVPRPDQTSEATEFKVKFQFENESDFIELDLFDVTEASPLSQTKFNVPGFNGITIRPIEFWPYDPDDGSGPIYDSDTGEQLRPFPV